MESHLPDECSRLDGVSKLAARVRAAARQVEPEQLPLLCPGGGQGLVVGPASDHVDQRHPEPRWALYADAGHLLPRARIDPPGLAARGAGRFVADAWPGGQERSPPGLRAGGAPVPASGHARIHRGDDPDQVVRAVHAEQARLDNETTGWRGRRGTGGKNARPCPGPVKRGEGKRLIGGVRRQLAARVSARDSKLSRLWPGRKTSTKGNDAAMPRASGSY